MVSTLLHIHHAAFHGFHGNMLVLLLFDKLEHDNWVIIEAACLDIGEFVFSGFTEVLLSQSYISLVLCLQVFDNESFPSVE